jgi:phytoene dehydrogenase-like protein
MFTIAKALYSLATDLGVKFYFNTIVEKISVNDGVAEGVFVLNNLHKADVIICNQDIYFVYKNLLPKKFTIKRVLKQERSSSALIFYWGIKKEFSTLQLHNILFSNNYEEEFKMLSENKEIYKDPTTYINITSKMTKNDAPNKCENWFVMINTPYDVGQNWQDLIINSRKNIIKKINKVLDVSIEEYIVCEEILTPKLIESSTQSFGGSLYGSSSNARGSAFFRHPNFSTKISNLYFCGGSVHPGGGIPLALSSSKIIDELIS